MVEDSKLSEALQVTDLFTGSISRRLNATASKDHPRDGFAEYFAQAVNLTSAATKDEQRGDVVYHLTL